MDRDARITGAPVYGPVWQRVFMKDGTFLSKSGSLGRDQGTQEAREGPPDGRAKVIQKQANAVNCCPRRGK